MDPEGQIADQLLEPCVLPLDLLDFLSGGASRTLSRVRLSLPASMNSLVHEQ